jgi:hypothetical protein
MDWTQFESLSYEVLVRDDLPRLRKLGGVADAGADAVEESFFQDESRLSTVVQVTSQAAQVYKVKSTISVLRKNDLEPKRLVVVFRQPMSSTVRTKIQEEGMESGVVIDPRDQSYLVAQLSKHSPDLYARYFEDLKTQIGVLLDQRDPLEIASGRLRHALLAAVGTFVINPTARLARRALFEKTVLAAMVAASEDVSLEVLTQSVAELIPEESIAEVQVRAAVEGLMTQGYCESSRGLVRVSEKAFVEVGQVMAESTMAYEELVQYVLGACNKARRLDDATEGYLERNVRRALLTVFRAVGLHANLGANLLVDSEVEDDLLRVLSRDVGEVLGRRALASISGYVEAPANQRRLSTLMRTYSALSIRNLDPLGRRWQEATLRRTAIALDTDAVLFTIVEELPEHAALLSALRALASAGVRILVSPLVIREAAGHIGRAEKTLRKFRDQLGRMSESMVDSEVWHAVVRGYYYAGLRESPLDWDEYWQKYYDRSRPEEYVGYLLEKRVKVCVEPLGEIPDDWLADFEIICAELLEYKERKRWKAEFREEDQMSKRIHDDVRMGMHLARRTVGDGGLQAYGYLASEDLGFDRMEKSKNWGGRPRVLVLTRTIPELAEFACGATIPEDQIVRLLFNPIIVAAAHLMKDEIESLSRAGIDLSRIPLDRLEWDLSRELSDVVHELRGARELEEQGEKVARTVAAIERARRMGYGLDSGVERVVSRFEAVRNRAASESAARNELESALKDAVFEAAGKSKKGRRRAARVLRELGLEESETEADSKTVESPS